MDGESENKIRKEKKKSYVGLFFDGGVTQTCHVCDMKNNNEAYSIFFFVLCVYFLNKIDVRTAGMEKKK